MKVPKMNKYHVGNWTALLESFGFFSRYSYVQPMRVRAHCSLKKNRWFTRNSIDKRIWTKLKRKTMTKTSFMLREIKSWNNNVLLKLILDSEHLNFSFLFFFKTMLSQHIGNRNCYRCLMVNVQHDIHRNETISSKHPCCADGTIKLYPTAYFALYLHAPIEHCWSCCSLWLSSGGR